MKINFLIPIICIILLAILVADIVYQKYLETNMSYEGNVYFLQQGVYTDESNIKGISANYITVEEENKYYTYLGMTMDKTLAEKIKSIYNEKGIPVYIKSVNITNQEFLNELGQYDILLKNTNEFSQIENILETILSTYEETLNNN